MLKAYSAAYGMVVANITTLMVSFSIARSSGDDLLAIGITSSKDLEDIRRALGQLPESALLRRKIDRIIERVESHSVTGNDLLVLATEFRDDFFSEMGRYLFLAVPAERRELFEQQQPVFGEEFSRQFPELVSDASAAARCLAVDEWTAAVFHLMRVLEGGIHDVALTLGIAFKRGERTMEECH
jgi:hypothetical protein